MVVFKLYAAGAPRKPEDSHKVVGAMRRCLRCSKAFDSVWSGNRICRVCCSRGGSGKRARKTVEQGPEAGG